MENLELELKVKNSVLRKHYETESSILGMEGELKKIHISQTPAQLGEIDEEMKKIYSFIVGDEYTSDEHLINIKMKNEELLRIYTFVDNVLFGDQDDALTKVNDYKFLFFECPSGLEISEHGILYYYFKAGQITVQKLVERYTKFELLFMASFLYLFVKEKFVLDANCSKDGLAMIICSLIEDIPLDPRMIITMYGPRIIHNNVDANLNVFDNIKEASHLSGLKTNEREIPELYRHYCISQVYPSVFNEIDTIQSPYKQINLDKTPIKDFEKYLYYGMGDGLSQYTPMLKTNLPELLKNKSHSVIRKAIYLLQKEKGTEDIVMKLFSLMNKRTEKPIEIKPSDQLKNYLTILFNVGVQFLNCQRELLAHNPVDIQLRLNVEPTSPYWTDRLRNIISSLLDLIEKPPKELENESLVTIRKEKYKVIKNETQYHLKEFVQCLRSLLDLGLIDAIFGFGKDLIATANYYYYNCYSTTITVSGINIDDVPEI